MKGPRQDYFSAVRTLTLQLIGLLLFGSAVAWGMSFALPLWLWAIGGVVLLACGAGVFLTSGRLLTRHHPVISVFGDRLWYRGVREQVIMLRNVREARHVRLRRAGLSVPCLELDLLDDDEPLQLPLIAVDGDPDDLVALIMERVEVLRRDAPAG
jgi:hypothetical protein